MHVHCGPSFIPSVADVLQQALRAFRTACDAQLPAVPDDLMGKQNPLVLRNDLHQILLDLSSVGLFRKFEASRDAGDVGVDDDSYADIEPTAQNDISGLASYAGEGQ